MIKHKLICERYPDQFSKAVNAIFTSSKFTKDRIINISQGRCIAGNDDKSYQALYMSIVYDDVVPIDDAYDIVQKTVDQYQEKLDQYQARIDELQKELYEREESK